tara:strand:- start:4647 stop:5561 length:915 start_codon:yes stop_codon:yes gene_type:complete
MKGLTLPSPIQEIHHPLFIEKHLQVFVKRDDLIHPEISGNKWRKLKYNIEEVVQKNKVGILTFGGAYSNHIVATAVACQLAGIACIGVIRGDEFKTLNPSLQQAQNAGMKLHFVSRAEYALKTEMIFLNSLKEKFEDFFMVPEGGSNDLGVKGCQELLDEIKQPFDYLLCAAGTGTTAAGIYRGMTKGSLVVFPALKGAEKLEQDIRHLAGEANRNVQLNLLTDYHFGGYAKIESELIEFVEQFYKDFSIPLDLVYTAKMAFGFWDLLKKDFFKEGSEVLLVHTGGIQGNRGMIERYGLNLSFG